GVDLVAAAHLRIGEEAVRGPQRFEQVPVDRQRVGRVDGLEAVPLIDAFKRAKPPALVGTHYPRKEPAVLEHVKLNVVEGDAVKDHRWALDRRALVHDLEHGRKNPMLGGAALLLHLATRRLGKTFDRSVKPGGADGSILDVAADEP